MDDRVLIFDTTLRDGEQSAGAAMTVEEKVEIARQLEKLNVDIIEAGFPIASPGDFEAVSEISAQVRGPKIASLARCVPDDVDSAWEAIKGAERPRIHVFISSSDVQIMHQLRSNPEEVLDTAVACEAYDLVRSRPQMTAMSHIVQRLVQGRPISFLHPHAPGTAEHDAWELAVCAAALEKSATGVSDLYACKGALGHGLGAAGLAALVIACLCARTGIRPPMPWLGQPIESPLPISAAGPVRSSTKGCHLVVATGFGGHVAGAVIRP